MRISTTMQMCYYIYVLGIENGLSFRCRLTQDVLEKRPLNGCSSIIINWQKEIIGIWIMLLLLDPKDQLEKQDHKCSSKTKDVQTVNTGIGQRKKSLVVRTHLLSGWHQTDENWLWWLSHNCILTNQGVILWFVMQQWLTAFHVWFEDTALEHVHWQQKS